MFLSDARSYLITSWILIILAIAAVAGTASTGILLTLALSAVVPPLVLLTLWKERQPHAVAENPYVAHERT